MLYRMQMVSLFFWLNGFPTGFLVDWWKRCSSPPKNYFGGRGSSKILYCGHYCGSSAPNILGTEEPLILCTQNGHTITADYYWILCPQKFLSSQKPLLDHAASPMVKISNFEVHTCVLLKIGFRPGFWPDFRPDF